MSAVGRELHESLFDLFEARLETLRAGAPGVGADGEAWTQTEVDAAIAELERDKELLLGHWRVQDGVVAHQAPPNARACGQPQPCPHALELAQKYRLI